MPKPAIATEQYIEWAQKALEDFTGKSNEELDAVAHKCERYEGTLRQQAQEPGAADSEVEEFWRGSVRCTVRKTVARALKEGRLASPAELKSPEDTKNALQGVIHPLLGDSFDDLL